MRHVHFKNRHEPFLTCCLSGSLLSANPLRSSCRLIRVVVCAFFPARNCCWKGRVALDAVDVESRAIDFMPSAALTCANGLTAALDAIAAIPVMEEEEDDLAKSYRRLEKVINFCPE